MKLTKHEQSMLLENSVERMINTTLEVALHSTHGEAGANHDDWLHLKWLVVKLWNDARNETFKEGQKGGTHE